MPRGRPRKYTPDQLAGTTVYQRYKPKMQATFKQYYKRKRKFLIDLLGGKCSNPKCAVAGGMADVRCLQLDHIDGGGSKEKRSFGGALQMILHYADHPDEARQKLQVLCANCNWIKRHDNREVRKA